MVTGFARVVDFATERLLFSFRSQYGNYIRSWMHRDSLGISCITVERSQVVRVTCLLVDLVKAGCCAALGRPITRCSFCVTPCLDG